MAGLLPTTYFGSRQALEGKDKSRLRGRQVGSKLHPCGARSEPQTCPGEGLTGVPGIPGCPRGPGGPVSPCKDTRAAQGAAQDIPQPCILLQPTPFPRWILYGKIRNSPQILILVPDIPLHPALTCFPLGPGLPETPWGPGLPWETWQDVTQGDRGPGGEGEEPNLPHTLKPSSPCWPRSPLLPFSP